MKVVPALVPLLSLLGGCVLTLTTDGDDELNGDGDGDGDGDTSSTSEGESDTSTTTSTDDEIGTDTDTDSSTDTGEELCGLSEGPAEPWLVLSQFDTEIGDMSPVTLECGGQGSFMIRFNVALGGFVPTDLDVPVEVVLDVEGFNLGPDGHFARSDYTVWVGCCSEDYNSPDYCYYDPLLVTLFPPDEIPDLEVLHGLPGTLTVTLTAEDTPVEQVIPVQIWAMPDESWEYCNYSYGTGFDTDYGTGGLIEPLGIDARPIPID